MQNNPIFNSFWIGSAITAALVGIAHTFNWQFSLVEMLAVWTSFICTLLCVYQSRWNYPVGIVSTALLSYSFFGAELYGSMALNLYLIPTLIYGWYVWGPDSDTRPVQSVQIQDIWKYVVATGIVFIGAVTLIKHFGGTLPAWDATILVGSVLAQFLLDRKKIETWAVWAAVNIVSIWLYFNSGLYLLGMQFVLFLGNTIYGYISWRKTLVSN